MSRIGTKPRRISIGELRREARELRALDPESPFAARVRNMLGKYSLDVEGASALITIWKRSLTLDESASAKALLSNSRRFSDHGYAFEAQAKKLRWRPIEEIPEEEREVLRQIRMAALSLYGGRPHWRGVETVDGWSSGLLRSSHPIFEYLRSGAPPYSNSYPPRTFWYHVAKIFLGVRMAREGFVHVPLDSVSRQARYNAIANIEKWPDIDFMRDPDRDLALAARHQLIEILGGRFPSAGFRIGDQHTGELRDTPLILYLRRGIRTCSPHTLVFLLRTLLFDVHAIDPSRGKYRHGETSLDAASEIYKWVAGREKWVDIRKIPNDRQRLVGQVRYWFATNFGGSFPKMIRTEDGWQSKHLKYCPYAELARSGEIVYSTKLPPEKYWRSLEDLMSVQIIGGRYVRAPLQPEIVREIEGFRMTGIHAWQAAGYRPGQTVPHPAQTVVLSAGAVASPIQAASALTGQLQSGATIIASGLPSMK